MQHTYNDLTFNIKDKTIVIIGGCGLIGKELTKELYKRGAHLLVVDKKDADPQKIASEFTKNVKAFEVDVSDSVSVKYLAEACKSIYNRIDVLINCHQYKPAGFVNNQPEFLSDEVWNEILNVNLSGTFYTCREFGKIMIDQKKGSIINFASVYGVVSSNPSLYLDTSLGNPAAYSASKGGVVMLTRYLAVHWASRGVRVNSITPHGVMNNHEDSFINQFRQLSPMGRMMRPCEVTGAIVFLSSEASSYLTGSNLIIDGGWTAW